MKWVSMIMELRLCHRPILIARSIAKAQINCAERSLSRRRYIAFLIYAACIVAVTVHTIGIVLIESVWDSCHAARSELSTDRSTSCQCITPTPVHILLK